MDAVRITSPIDSEVVKQLTVSTKVLISGVIYTIRDLAHLRLIQAMDRNEGLPFDLKGQTLYYCGPTSPRPGRIIGSAGPTTSSSFDIHTPRLLSAGVRAMIGKGDRSPEVQEAIQQHKGVYFITISGAGALLSQTIKQVEFVAYEDLGIWNAVLRLEVKDFPAIVAYDMYGGDLFEQGKSRYQR